MEVSGHHIGKKYQREWIFRRVDFHIPSGERFGIVGSNGSGKSTLLQIISGYLSPTEGELSFRNQDVVCERDQVFSHVSWCTPALQFIDGFTLLENIRFATSFRGLIGGMSHDAWIERTGLAAHRHKKLEELSSGMRQRVKLAWAICSESSMLLLDEPVSHLDRQAVLWFQQLLEEFLGNRTLVIASNANEDELFLCPTRLDVVQFKP
jgi:ABC-type multidrug transport system ATPase subunit